MTPSATIEPEDAAVRLRPIGPGDLAFLAALYASTRAEELAVVPWTEAQKAAFLQQQFAAQHHHYQTYYAAASFDVVLVGDQPAGRLYVDRGRREIRIVDIAFLPAFRNRGLGTRFIRALQAEAASSGRALSIHVERLNPALALYARLGFTLVEDKGVYLLMEWTPSAT